MPESYICFDPPDFAPDVASLPAGLDQPLRFAAFHNPAKINPDVVRLWARVLLSQPEASIAFVYAGYEVPDVQSRIRGWFAEAQIRPERLEFSGAVPRAELLARYGETDIALDPFPYSGDLTTLEALWMGVPVVTWPGATFAGRHSLSHLTIAGLPELVAQSSDDYLTIVDRRGRDREALAALRAGLRARLSASPLLDPQRLVPATRRRSRLSGHSAPGLGWGRTRQDESQPPNQRMGVGRST
jgi:predicted O-linked N-acetylglucosamine transferase (SPINDLY family)